jgi:hypothetical protein
VTGGPRFSVLGSGMSYLFDDASYGAVSYVFSNASDRLRSDRAKREVTATGLAGARSQPLRYAVTTIMDTAPPDSPRFAREAVWSVAAATAPNCHIVKVDLRYEV